VIGSHEDLERASVADVKEFFQRFYFPKNASLVIAGDFDSSQARELVSKHLDSLPARPGVEHRKSATAAKIEGTVRATLTDSVELPLSVLVWHSPALFKEGDADLDVLASVLGSGKSSRLYRSLVYEKKLAQEVSVAEESSYLTSRFQIMVYARPGSSQDEIEAEVDRQLGELRKNGPTQREVDRARNRIETSFWERAQSLGERADLLNRYQFFFGDPGAIRRDRARYDRVTVESVKKWANEVLRPDARLLLRVVPEKGDK
jgi:zinc protease